MTGRLEFKYVVQLIMEISEIEHLYGDRANYTKYGAFWKQRYLSISQVRQSSNTQNQVSLISS